MNSLYKVYDPDGKANCFSKVSDLRKFLDLSDKDVSKCFIPGVHTTENGDTVITY